jgi:hypothetical protein
MEMSAIAAGLGGIRAAAELAKALRKAVKSEAMKPDEIAGRIGEIYDYILDSKAALIEVQDENQHLRAAIKAVTDDKAFRESLTFNEYGYYERTIGSDLERYCSSCLDKDNARIRLTGGFRCQFHGYRQHAHR